MLCVDTKLTEKCQPGGMVRMACCCSHNHQATRSESVAIHLYLYYKIMSKNDHVSA